MKAILKQANLHIFHLIRIFKNVYENTPEIYFFLLSVHLIITTETESLRVLLNALLRKSASWIFITTDGGISFDFLWKMKIM